LHLQVTSVTITAPDPLALAGFYARLLDRPVTSEYGPRTGEPSTAGWAQLRSPRGSGELILVQPQERVRVCFDPAGHPFCLFQ
jgi:hypothetical protein